ncbi:MAG: hypothetical protein E6K59_11535, partial [Nitrospirae bacterium]
MLTVEEQRQVASAKGTGSEKERAVQRMFSSIARYYDLNNSLLSLGLHHSWKRKAVELMADPPHLDPLPPGERETLRLTPGERDSLMPLQEARWSVKLVLDVGAGTADLALLAARRLGQKARIVAADLNGPMLTIGL